MEVIVNDGRFDSNTAVTTISMNTPPTVDLDSSDGTGEDFSNIYNVGNGGVAIADTDTEVTDDTDTNIESATVTLTNFLTGDELLVDGINALTGGTFTTSGGNDITFSAVNVDGEIVITLTSAVADSVPKAEYDEVIEAITFNNTNANPDTSDRIIQVTVNDGDSDSDIAPASLPLPLRLLIIHL